MSTTKAMTAEQNQRARAIVRGLLRSRFNNDQTATADALGIRQGTLSDFLAGKKGAGGKIMGGLLRIAPDEARAIAGGEQRNTTDTLSMARTAAENVVRAGIAGPERAWLTMRDARPREPSVHGFYLEAVRMLTGAQNDQGGGVEQPPPAQPAPSEPPLVITKIEGIPSATKSTPEVTAELFRQVQAKGKKRGSKLDRAVDEGPRSSKKAR